MNRRQGMWVALFAALIGLVGCDRESGNVDWSPRALDRPSLTAPPPVAWLRQRLPETAFGYLRLPNPWQRLTGAADHVLASAQQDRSHRELVKALDLALAGQLQAAFPDASHLPRWLLLEQRVPILELATLAPVDGSLVPDVLIGLSLPAATDLDAWLQSLVTTSPKVRVLSAADAEGRVTLMAGPMPLYLRWQAQQGRLWGLTGFGASSERLDTLAAAVAGPTPVSETEAERDSGGAGLALWLDPSRAWPMLRPTLDEKVAAGLELLALHESDSLWLGSTDRGGRAAWGLELAVPGDGIGRYLFPVDQVSDLRVTGDPDSVTRLALPSAAELQAMIDFTLQNTVDGRLVREKIAEARAEFGAATGFELNDLLDAVGPDLVRVEDEAGTWLAVRVRDREALGRVIEGATAVAGSGPETRDRAGLTVRHWALPGWLDLAARQDPSAIEPPLDYLRRLRSHLFWVDQGEYLIVADVPQVLIDRQASNHGVALETWLHDGMDVDWRHAVAAAMLSVEDLPRDVYHAYLEGLLAAADLVEAEVDVTRLPSAGELKLPEIGRFGVQVDTGPGALAARLSFEYSAFDPLLAGDAYLAAAVVGVLASVAIPAYQDYTLRARIADAIDDSRVARQDLSERLSRDGALPDPSAWTPPVSAAGSVQLRYDGEGLTLIFVGIDPAVEGATLRFVPDAIGGWRCARAGTSVTEKWLPASCRQALREDAPE